MYPLSLKLLILKNSILNELKYSKLKLFTVLTISLFLLSGEFYLFLYLFSFLGNIQGIGIVVIEKLFSLFFMAIFFLLVFSNIIVSYSTIFNSPELPILFSYPLRYLDIFDIKFMESIFLSSWAFFFIMLPFISAFGIYKNLALPFYFIGIAYLIPFIIIAGILGNLITVCIGRIFNKRYFKILLILLAITLIPMLIMYAKRTFIFYGMGDGSLTFTLNSLMPHFRFSQLPMLPSYWVSNGILSFSWNKYNDSLFFFLFILSNCLLGIIILRYLAKKTYYNTWENIRSFHINLGKNIQTKFTVFIDLIVDKFHAPKSAFISKDLKLFIRDPVQWSQGLMFFGLLAIYFGNLKNLSYNLVAGYWKNAIVFLNTMATSLTLASLCVRFIFPQISLEGNKAWLLKLAPVSFKKILLGKFWGAFIPAVFIMEGLIFLSNYMLEVEKVIFYFSSAITLMICFGLVGLSCGLGALFPNFKQNNPIAIVSGIGGTLNFVFSLIYLGLIIWILAPFLYTYIVSQNMVSPHMILKLYMLSGIIFILSCITGIIPMYIGIRNLERIEF